MISEQQLKIAVLFTLLIATFIFTLIPLSLRSCILHEHNAARRRRLKTVISLLNCFTAGVFLGTFLLDLLPEVREGVSGMLDEAGIKTEFPITEFIVLFGFFLLLIIEQCVTRWKATHDHIDIHHHHAHDDNSGAVARFENSYGSVDSYGSVSVPQSPDERTPLSGSQTNRNPLLEEEISPEERNELVPDPSRHSLLRPLMLLIALSIHSVFEGLTIGLQPTIKDILQIFVALTLHKCIVAFSIGLNNVQSKFPLRIIIVLNLVFALMSPIGIAIGIGLGNISDSLAIHVVNSVLQGLACGTFLYVVFMEILPHEFMVKRNRPDRMLKVLLSLIGIAVVSAVVLLDTLLSTEQS